MGKVNCFFVDELFTVFNGLQVEERGKGRSMAAVLGGPATAPGRYRSFVLLDRYHTPEIDRGVVYSADLRLIMGKAGQELYFLAKPRGEKPNGVIVGFTGRYGLCIRPADRRQPPKQLTVKEWFGSLVELVVFFKGGEAFEIIRQEDDDTTTMAVVSIGSDGRPVVKVVQPRQAEPARPVKKPVIAMTSAPTHQSAKPVVAKKAPRPKKAKPVKPAPAPTADLKLVPPARPTPMSIAMMAGLGGTVPIVEPEEPSISISAPVSEPTTQAQQAQA